MDEYIEGLCSECKQEVNNLQKCSRCGKNIEESSLISTNKNFDENLFNEMAGD